jgi:AcrR family transcriptional regulator
VTTTKGRPRDPEATRAAILNAAEEVFAQLGFAGARVEAIAAASGYNNGLIFRYFTDKLGLYRAVVLRIKAHTEAWFTRDLAPLFDANTAAAGEIETVRAVLGTTLRWVFDYFLAHVTYRRILAWEAAEGWSTFDLVHADVEQSWWLEPASRFLVQAQAAHLIREDIYLPMLISDALYMALLHQWFIPRSELDFPGVDFSSSEALARAREQIVQLILNGIENHSDHSSRPEGDHQ